MEKESQWEDQEAGRNQGPWDAVFRRVGPRSAPGRRAREGQSRALPKAPSRRVRGWVPLFPGGVAPGGLTGLEGEQAR